MTNLLFNIPGVIKNLLLVYTSSSFSFEKLLHTLNEILFGERMHSLADFFFLVNEVITDREKGCQVLITVEQFALIKMVIRYDLSSSHMVSQISLLCSKAA